MLSFKCETCYPSYSGGTCRHFKIRIEDISKRITSLILLNIYTLPQYALTHIILFVLIIDKANSKFNLKIKEALQINWRKPNLNIQQNHLTLTRSLWPPLFFSAFVCCCSFCCYLFFSAFLFHLLFSLSLTLIIGIFYCLNDISLWLHLIARCDTPCITSFSFIYCFIYLYANYRHLLHFVITSSLYNTLCNRFYNNYVINICTRQLLWFM